MSILVFMGIKHCGKSTQGRCIAQKYNVPFFDTDDVIAKQTKLSPRELYTQQGESAFKVAECEACKNILSQIDDSGTARITAVIATGGGICTNKDALAALAGTVQFIFLQSPEKLAADRIVCESSVAPDGTILNIPAYIAKKSPHSIAEVRDIFHSFYEERIKLYSEIATVTVEMLDAPVQVNTERILKAVQTLAR